MFFGNYDFWAKSKAIAFGFSRKIGVLGNYDFWPKRKAIAFDFSRKIGVLGNLISGQKVRL